MKNKKRIWAFICALFTAFSVAACEFVPSNDDDGNIDPPPPVEQPQEPSEAELSFVVDENNYKAFANTFVPANQLTAFHGDYQGNAARIEHTQDSASYQIVNPFSEEILTKMQDEYGYTHVSVWIAVNGIENGSLSIEASSAEQYSVMETAGYTEYPYTASDNGQWSNVSVPIALYKETLSAADGSGVQYARLMTVKNDDVTGDIAFYLGDMRIVREPSVLTVNAFTAKGIWNKDVSSTYVSADDETLMGFSGGYVGGAKRFKASANVNWRVQNYFTLAQLNALKQYYSHVTLWFAFDNLETGKIHLENWPTDKMPKFNNYSTVNGGDKTFVPEDNGVWHSMTASIDDFINVCTAEDGQMARDSFYLFRVVNKATAKEGTLMQLYIGDIFFENLN